MFFQGCAFATSPHGASQTIFNPGISGVPDRVVIAAMSGIWSAADERNASAPIAVPSERKAMLKRVPQGSLFTMVTRGCEKRAPASAPAPTVAADQLLRNGSCLPSWRHRARD